MNDIHFQIRVLIVEDEVLIAENLAIYLNNSDFIVTAIAYDYNEAIHQLSNNKPDIVLLDINLEDDKDGIDLAEFIFNKIKIPYVFLTSYSDKHTLERAKKFQPSGFLIKPFHDKSLLSTLEISLSNYSIQRNKEYPALELDIINSKLLSHLSPREFEVIQLIYEGNTNIQITQKLFISINTLKRHINNAYTRLDVKSRSEAIEKLKFLMAA
ncbi:MAG: response regulator transcription factor [Saprospiraceae bacterium]|nr:response regulator transcription factor [Saprospiraceae bacterium]